MPTTLTLGFSPCPNDTFIFDALLHGGVDTGDLQFEVVLDDVQTLNRWAMEGRLDISKISYGVLPLVTNHYAVLQSGGALGYGVGPLLIGQQAPATQHPEGLQQLVQESVVALPGEHTTAHFLFRHAFPHAAQKQFMRFDAIEDFVQAGKGLGVIIHENRFTYADRGLHAWQDLGTLWEQKTGFPIPLGGIVARRSLPAALLQQINQWIARSVALAWQQYPTLSPYVRQHAQEMDEAVMRQHINLYVNDFSSGMGETGREAIAHMMQVMGSADGLQQLFVA